MYLKYTSTKGECVFCQMLNETIKAVKAHKGWRLNSHTSYTSITCLDGTTETAIRVMLCEPPIASVRWRVHNWWLLQELETVYQILVFTHIIILLVTPSLSLILPSSLLLITPPSLYAFCLIILIIWMKWEQGLHHLLALVFPLSISRNVVHIEMWHHSGEPKSSI